MQTISFVEKSITGQTFLRAWPDGDDTFETVRYATQTFNFLLQRGERLDAKEFADRISKSYDTNTPPVGEVAAALKRLH